MIRPASHFASFVASHWNFAEQMFSKDYATGSGLTDCVIDFSSAANAASNTNRGRIVWQIEFDPLSPQSGGWTVGLGSFSNNIWVNWDDTVQQFTLATGDSSAFGHSPIQQLIGRPAGLTIPVGGTVITTGITLTGTAVVDVDANVALASGTASANAQPPLESDSSNLKRSLRALHLRRNLLTRTQTEALERQLEALLSEEDEPESPDVSEPSLHGLIDFLSEHEAPAHPSLSITRSGYFAASWSPRRRAKLTIVFNPGGTADWIAIDLDATHPVHEKGSLSNLPDDFAMWMRA